VSEPSLSGRSRRTDGPRPRRTGDKRARILSAAVRVFAKKGFYATRVSEVAKAAGVAYRKIDPLKLDMTLATRTVSRPYAQKHALLPLAQESGKLVVAVANPFDRELFENLERALVEITGFAGVSLQPNAGSQGEYAGLLVPLSIGPPSSRIWSASTPTPPRSCA